MGCPISSRERSERALLTNTLTNMGCPIPSRERSERALPLPVLSKQHGLITAFAGWEIR